MPVKALEPVLCSRCGGCNVVNGGSAEGKQRYKCRHQECPRSIFIREYAYRAYMPEVKQQIIDMALNGSGGRTFGLGNISFGFVF